MTTDSSAFRLIVIVIVNVASFFVMSARLLANDEAATKSVSERLLVGECLAPQDPLMMADDAFPVACLKGSALGEAMVGLNSSKENAWLLGAKGYAGIHLSSWLSLHGAGEVSRAENSHTGRTTMLVREADYWTANLGNLALHRWRLAVGKPLLPFGVGDSPIMDSFQLLGTKGFWSGLESGAVITYDNKRDTQVELGGFSTSPRNKDKYQARVSNDAASTRFSYDLPALDGSRLIFSFYGDRLNERRLGFAFVNVSVKGDVTHFEFVRRYHFAADIPGDHEQILRLAFVGAPRGTSRWAAQYDDVRRKYRLGVLGQDMILGDQISGRLGLAYRKGEAEGVESRWFVASGVKWGF